MPGISLVLTTYCPTRTECMALNILNKKLLLLPDAGVGAALIMWPLTLIGTHPSSQENNYWLTPVFNFHFVIKTDFFSHGSTMTTQQSWTSHPCTLPCRRERSPNFANTKQEGCVLLAVTCGPSPSQPGGQNASEVQTSRSCVLHSCCQKSTSLSQTQLYGEDIQEPRYHAPSN